MVSFTLALFLSGYVLQQATVRDLRAAIKPQMVQPLAELQVNLNSDTQAGPSTEDQVLDTSHVAVDGFGDEGKTVNTSEEIIVQETVGKITDDPESSEDDMVGATRWQKAQRMKQKLLAEQQKAQKPIHDIRPPSTKDSKLASKELLAEKPLSKAERRKKIKEEIIAAGQGETFQGYRRRMW